MNARPAASGDLPAIAELREAALAELRPTRGGLLYAAPALPGVADPDRPLWVGVLAGAVVGYLAASSAGTLGAVDAVYVDRGCRGVGVGAAMMNAALAWFKDRGCAGVDAIALPGARDTKNFFEESGFTARLLVLHRPLV